jgi:Major tropism determinant N-terminal domain
LSEQLQLRRGTAAQVTAFTGSAGEVVMDTTNNRLVVNDGVTAGGAPAAKLSEVITNGRTPVSDAAYTALATDRMLAYTALTAARIVTLPASSAYPTGTRLLVIDESGNCSVTKILTLTAAGSDTINGAASAIVNEAYGFIGVESNGAGHWTVTDLGFMPPLASLAASAHGANIQAGVIEFLQSGLTGASVTCSTQIPANCILLAVGMRVATAITCSGGGTSFEVGDAGQTGDGGNSASRFGSLIPFTVGTTNYGIIGPTGIYSACNIILTPNAGAFTAGAVRLSISYMLANPSAA